MDGGNTFDGDYSLIIIHGNKQTLIKAACDSGNNLTDSFSGKPVIVRTIDAFERCEFIDEIVVVTSNSCAGIIGSCTNFKKIKAVVSPGESRQKSVYNGVSACSDNADIVCIHDGARPLVTQQVIKDSLETAVKFNAATAAVPVKDTIKRGINNIITETLPREQLYQIQTPQVFNKQLYIDCYRAAKKEYSDDCQLIEAFGRQVALSKGDYRNLKLTTAEDFAIAEAILKQMGY